MSDIKTVISGVVDIQNKTISKLKFNNNAIISLSGTMRALSGAIDNCLDLSTSINGFYNKSETEEKIENYFSEVSGNFTHTYNNLKYLNKIYLSSNGIPGYEVFTELPYFSTSNDIVDLNAATKFFSWINDGNGFYIYANNSSKYGTIFNLPTNITNFTNLSLGSDTAYGISNGNLYVVGLDSLASNHTNTSEGSLLGTTLTVSKTQWTQVPNISNCFYVRAFLYSIAVLVGDGLSGTIYMGGYNKGLVLGTASYDGNGNPQTVKNNSSNKINSYLLNTLTPITLIENNERITPNDWIKVEKGQFNVIAQRSNGKLYTWGSLIYGCNGDGSGYWTDMSDSEVSEVTNGSVTRALDFGRAEPEVLKVREYESNYDPETNPNAYTDVEYSDWIDFSHTYYHAVALRRDASTGKNYVYLWGANEYGQFGNGNYLESSLNSSLATFDSGVEIKSRPWKLTSDLFPYFDVVKVKATHYGTFLFRENGDVYFAGSNKRNYLGMYSQSSGLDTFFSKFTKVNLLSDYYDCETYGSIQVRSIPYLNENADNLLESILSGELAPEKIANATTKAHNHTVNPALIDEVVTVASNYVDTLPVILANSHIHVNSSTLNKLTDSNGILFLDGEPIFGGNGSSTGGSTIEVDPSNVKLDDFASIFGLSNIAGGYPLDVISYKGDSINDKSYVVVAPPSDSMFHNFDRWPSVYKKTGETYEEFLTSENLRKGGWAVVYKSTSLTSSNVLSSYLLTSISSIKTFFENINSNSAYRGYIYELSGVTGTSWSEVTAGAQIKSAIAASSYPMSSMFIKYEDGLVTKDRSIKLSVNDESEYHSLSASYGGFGSGGHISDTTSQYLNVYNKDGELLIASSLISAGLYNDAGVKIKFTAQLLDPKDYEVSENDLIPIYSDYYDNASQTGTPVILGTTISGGIYKQVGTVLQKITIQDAIETFDTSLFKVGTSIYVRPTKNDFTGIVYQKYEIERVVPVYSTTAYEGEYALEYAILKLSKEITADSDSSSSFKPGSTEDPMVAIIKSKYRNSTSEVGGEHNGAAGFNAISNGNGNITLGDFSTTFGIQNTNTGFQASVIGVNNGCTGSNAYVLGEGNAIAGSYAFIWGSSNGHDGQGAFIIGSSNFNSGTSNHIVGYSNTTDGNRSYIFGSRNYVAENVGDSFLIGSGLYNECNKTIAIGWNGIIEKYEGNFPTDEQAVTMTAAALETAINNGTYSSSGRYFQNSFRVCMGDKITKTEDKHLDVLTYTKYRWEVNDSYFALANNSTARSGKEPKLIIPDHKWTFTGKIYMNFTEATLRSGSSDTFDVSLRNGGRVKTCDSGLELSAAALVDLDFDLANRFKIKPSDYSGTTTFNLSNFNDGDEFDLIIYNGVDFAFPASWRVDAVKSLDGTNIFVFYKVYNIDGYIIVRFIRLLDSNSDNDISVVDVSSGNYEIVDGIINQIL